MVRQLVELKGEVNTTMDGQASALYVAAQEGSTEVIDVLVELQA